MKTSEMLKNVLCDPDGKVSVNGSSLDIRIIKESLSKIELLERYLEAFREIIRFKNEITVKFPPAIKDELKNEIIYCWKHIFKDFPEEEE